MQGPTDAPAMRALTAGLLLAMTLHAVHGLAVVAVLPVVAEDLDGRSLYGASLAAYLLASLVGFVGAGMASAVLYASLNLAYPAARRPQILAWLSGAWVLPGLLAPPLAAVTAEALGRRWPQGWPAWRARPRCVFPCVLAGPIGAPGSRAPLHPMFRRASFRSLRSPSARSASSA